MHAPVENTYFKTGWENVAEHHEALKIGVVRHVMKAIVGVRNAHVFGLASIA
jgi:hypothetical protein